MFRVPTSVIYAVCMLGAGCSSMALPCFPKDRPQLVGEWRFVRNPGANASVGELIGPAHPHVIEFRPDGTFTAHFSDDQLEKIRRSHPGQHVESPVEGNWQVDWFCAGDLFFPRQWLRMEPGIDHRLFSLDEDALILYFPGGSGCCDEQYVRVLAEAESK